MTSLTISPFLQTLISIPNVPKNTDHRCLKNFDLPSFLEDLNTALFDLDFHNQNNSDINITCNNFILMFNTILDQHATLRFASRKETRSFHKPWLTKGF